MNKTKMRWRTGCNVLNGVHFLEPYYERDGIAHEIISSRINLRDECHEIKSNAMIAKCHQSLSRAVLILEEMILQSGFPCFRLTYVPDSKSEIWIDLDELDKDLKNPNRYSIDENDLKRWGACSLKVLIL